MITNEDLERNESNIKATNLIIVERIKKVKVIREGYITELNKKYNDELLTKIAEIDKIIRNAEEILGCTTEEGAKIYAERFPSTVNKEGKITKRGIKRLGLLNKRFDLLNKRK